MIRQIELELPDCLPILEYGLFSKGPDQKQRAPAVREDDTAPLPHLSALLSRTLLAFAIEFERESDLSLAISANVVRLLNEEGVRARELPRLSGVSKELIKVSVGFLNKHRYVAIAPDPTAKGSKLVRLTAKGPAGSGSLSPAARRHRRALAGAPRRRHHPQTPEVT